MDPSDHYSDFYLIAHRSAAHSRFCERVYGRDLCQDGQTDMACLDEIIGRLGVGPGHHVLDVGCGAGGIAEYVSDRTGARVTGIDCAASAIETALARTHDKRDRLTFMQADMNALEFPARSFDAVMSIDSISWARQMRDVIALLARIIKPGGRLCIVTEQRRKEEVPADVLFAQHTPVARALAALNLDHECIDHTPSLRKFWPLARSTAESLREEFARDGAALIAENWLRYADEVYLPAIHADRIWRYLYIARV